MSKQPRETCSAKYEMEPVGPDHLATWHNTSNWKEMGEATDTSKESEMDSRETERQRDNVIE